MQQDLAFARCKKADDCGDASGLARAVASKEGENGARAE
jgi:hypothetical protein